ncbi:MAG: molecular chaperone HtpG [candidate division Zixibacteria bacterium]|nr:molecular chaperone HtpG [candidate division Zixibacteria bacterium]
MAAKRTKKFKTEVQQLLDLVIHSLYSKKEIFLRELISNASDAIDRLRFEALTDHSLKRGEGEYRIKISTDARAKTITISDNGIGMTADEVESNIGTIANSGTRNYLEQLKSGETANDAEFIGQFGVGFYSSFMVADLVTVLTRRAGDSHTAVRWTSKGDGNYTIEDAEREGNGTDITLHLRDDMHMFLEEWQIRQIVKDYSDYIAFPIVMDITRQKKSEIQDGEEVEVTEEETLNSMKAIWKKAKNEIGPDEHNEFYRHISHDYTDPLKVIHYIAEGATEFRALLYIPAQAPFDLFLPDSGKGVHLYVKNVFITDNCEDLLPRNLRFVRGVVDSSDLPLNVSREMLQDDAIIRRIRKNIVGKVLNTLVELKDGDFDTYLKFYAQFGSTLKEGFHFGAEKQEQLRELVLFHSSGEEDRPVSLREYVNRMPEAQKDIYYLTGENLDAVRQSPLLEVFRSKGYEVLFLVDVVDEWVVQALSEYDGKKLTAIHRGDLDLDSEDEKKERKEQREASRKDYKELLESLQKQLEAEVKEVRLSKRLTDSACCLVADKSGMDANMERIMRAMNQDVPVTKRILEVNPDHPVLKRMKDLLAANKDDPRLKDFADLLYGQALITEGSPVKDALRFTKLVSELMSSE